MRLRVREVIIATLLGVLSSRADAQDAAPARIIGHLLECHDGARLLVDAGWLTPDNDQHRPGLAGRTMIAAHCYAGGHDGFEVGFLLVPYQESQQPQTQYSSIVRSGTGNRTTYFGVLSERSMSGVLDNFRFIGGVGAYSSSTRSMTESRYSYNGQTQTYISDYTRRATDTGLNFGASFTLEGEALGALHLEARQHITTGGRRLVLTAGILF